MGVSQTRVAITDPEVIAEAERLTNNGWLKEQVEKAANSAFEQVERGTQTRTVTLGAGLNARERTFQVERKAPKLSRAQIKEAMAAAAKNHKPEEQVSKIQRPSVESLFDRFNQRGLDVITVGRNEREVQVKTVEKRAVDTSREWQEPEGRIDGLLTLQR